MGHDVYSPLVCGELYSISIGYVSGMGKKIGCSCAVEDLKFKLKSLNFISSWKPVRITVKAVKYIITFVFDRNYSWHGQLPLPLLTHFLPRNR